VGVLVRQKEIHGCKWLWKHLIKLKTAVNTIYNKERNTLAVISSFMQVEVVNAHGRD